MHRYIWLVPLLPLLGAALNGLLGRSFRFSERMVGAIAVGSVALAFLVSVLAVYSYGFSDHAIWPNPYVTSQDGAFRYTWIPGGAVEITQGAPERARSLGGGGESGATTMPRAGETVTPLSDEKGEYGELTIRGNEGARAAAAAATTRDPAGLGARAASDRSPNEHTGRGSVLDIEWSYQLDALSAIFMLIVTGVGLCIFIFATGYMHGDAGYYRFFAYLGLFMFSMLVLVMGSNFMLMFVGWEGVGLCSYLLIGYYFDRREAGDASRKAFITNRIGDFGFALAVFCVIATFGTTDYRGVMGQASAYPLELIGTWGIMSWIALGLFVGACGKSAQIPLFVWLPDAMAGPTPVSALIHAATMVTAGLYMVTRTNVIFQHSQTMMLVVAIVGALTALFAATIGITQNDIKKVLAYSTVSQLGFMFLACGVGAFIIGIFHVMTHAFFKALMFLGAGSVIHGMHHEQDMRRMGGLRKYMPYTYWTFLAGWLAICGIIPFSGFWSKDEILWNAASTNYIPGGWILWLVATIAATCTAFYMTRLVAMTFWGKERFREVVAGGQADEAHAQAYADGEAPHDAQTDSVGYRPRHDAEEHVGVAHDVLSARAASHLHDEHEHGSHTPHESPASMWVPLAILAVLAVIGGLVGISPAFTGGKHVGGRMNIINWLEPVIWNPQTRAFGKETEEEADKGQAHAPLPTTSEPATTAAAPGGHAATESAGKQSTASPYGNTGFNLAHAAEEKLGGHTASEWLFIIISLVAAGFGILLGLLFYVWRPHLPEVWAARLGPIYRASYNRYWVDELYGLLFTRRVMDGARGVYAVDSKGIDGAVNGAARLTRGASLITGAFDKYVVDGVVNGVAGFIKRLMSPLIRATQTGFAQNYALVMVLGLIAAVAVFFWPDLRAIFGR
ncbi:MAG TPA: NADH-quinone oxidoreductase subunit L [Pyrinomonadaceae bacterium]|jgi:NADH-quinone oxidoreductase subunit L|nr:NADH-quinone oxidoreductase subunit L [Pyrinomonadaceae bacterium]